MLGEHPVLNSIMIILGTGCGALAGAYLGKQCAKLVAKLLRRE